MADLRVYKSPDIDSVSMKLKDDSILSARRNHDRDMITIQRDYDVGSKVVIMPADALNAIVTGMELPVANEASALALELEAIENLVSDELGPTEQKEGALLAVIRLMDAYREQKAKLGKDFPDA